MSLFPAAPLRAIAVLLVTAAFFLRGVFLALVLPYAEPFDEPFHYAYAAFIAETGRIPGLKEPSISKEFARPAALLPWTAFGGDRISFEEFASLSASERAARRAEAYRYRPEDRRSFVSANYQTQQAPLAYLMAGGILALLPHAPFDTRLLVLRLFAIALACFTVPLAYAFFRRLLSKPSALAATLAFALFPGLGPFVGRFTNDALALPLVVALLGLFTDVSQGRLSGRRAVSLSLALAAGCWTKLYVLLLLPVAPLVALTVRGPLRKVVLRRSLATVFGAFLLFFPWMLHQRAETGDWFGLVPTKQAAAMGVTFLDRLAALPEIFKPRFAIVFGRTFLWPGAWSAMGAPAAASVFLTAVLLLLVLLPNVAARAASRRRAEKWRAGGLTILLFLIGQVAYATSWVVVAKVRGHPPAGGPDGWYLLVLLPVILAGGAALGRGVAAKFFLAAALLFLAAEWLLTFGVLASAYSGAVSANASNAPFSTFWPVLRSSLAAIKTFSEVGLSGLSPAWLGFFLFLWFAAALSSVILLLTAWRRRLKWKRLTPIPPGTSTLY